MVGPASDGRAERLRQGHSPDGYDLSWWHKYCKFSVSVVLICCYGVCCVARCQCTVDVDVTWVHNAQASDGQWAWPGQWPVQTPPAALAALLAAALQRQQEQYQQDQEQQHSRHQQLLRAISGHQSTIPVGGKGPEVHEEAQNVKGGGKGHGQLQDQRWDRGNKRQVGEDEEEGEGEPGDQPQAKRFQPRDMHRDYPAFCYLCSMKTYIGYHKCTNPKCSMNTGDPPPPHVAHQEEVARVMKDIIKLRLKLQQDVKDKGHIASAEESDHDGGNISDSPSETMFVGEPGQHDEETEEAKKDKEEKATASQQQHDAATPAHEHDGEMMDEEQRLEEQQRAEKQRHEKEQEAQAEAEDKNKKAEQENDPGVQAEVEAQDEKDKGKDTDLEKDKDKGQDNEKDKDKELDNEKEKEKDKEKQKEKDELVRRRALKKQSS